MQAVCVCTFQMTNIPSKITGSIQIEQLTIRHEL